MKDITKLRLVLFSECNRNCAGCCNKDWDIAGLPVVDFATFTNFDTIMLTGGEPMLRPGLVLKTIEDIREVNPEARIILYTALVNELDLFIPILDRIDGLTVTIHDDLDWSDLINLDRFITKNKKGNRRTPYQSLRLNVFADAKADYSFILIAPWKIKKNMEWIPNCPLPDGEVLMRL